MTTALIDEACVLVDVEATSRTELLSRMADDLAERGYVAPTFRDALLEREETYPTGLPTNVLKVAIPHTDPEHVHRSFISVARLAHPIAFHEMGNNAATVAVEIVFLLAIADKKSQLGTLQSLIGTFSDEPTMVRLRDAENGAALYTVVQERVGDVGRGETPTP